MYQTEKERIAALDRLDSLKLETSANEAQLATFATRIPTPETVAAIRQLITSTEAMAAERRSIEAALWASRDRGIDEAVAAVSQFMLAAGDHFRRAEGRPNDTDSVLETERDWLISNPETKAKLDAELQRRALARRIGSDLEGLRARLRRIPFERVDQKAALKAAARDLHALKRDAGLAPSILDILAGAA